MKGLSLDAQHKDLTDYANRMGYEIVGVYPDEGISARKPVSKRPALLRLLEDVKQNTKTCISDTNPGSPLSDKTGAE